jgi:uncharacterized RDD family membrane protein YckC
MEEKDILNYITKYKDSYPKESLVTQLKNSGASEVDIENAFAKITTNSNSNLPKSESLNNIQPNSQSLNNVEFGGFWIRFGAVLLDALIVSLPLSIITGTLVYATGIDSLSFLPTILFAIYIVYFEGTTGQTLGKKICGLKVISAKNGQTIGISMAVLRYVGKFISGLLLGIGYLMAAFDSKKRSLHDRIAATYVIKVKK